MKKVKLFAIALSAIALAACGKNGGTTGSTTSGSSSSSQEHVHNYNVQGKCECGSDVGRTLTEREAYGNDDCTFTPVNKKVYISFTTICEAPFYIDEQNYEVPSSTPEAEHKAKISSVEIYKDGDLTTELGESLGLRQKVFDDDETKYYYIETTSYLDVASKYYCVLTFVEDAPATIYVCAVEYHTYTPSWSDNSDHSGREAHCQCEVCHAEFDVSETYIYEVKLPSITLKAGVSISDNIALVRQSAIVCDGRVVINGYGCTDHSNSDIVESGNLYFFNFYAYLIADGYCFNETNTVVRDSANSIVTPKSVAEYAINIILPVGVE